MNITNTTFDPQDPDSSDLAGIEASGMTVRSSITFIIITTIVYVLFNISQCCFVKRTAWDIWGLYPISYFCITAIAVINFLYASVDIAGHPIAYWQIKDPSVVPVFLKMKAAEEFLYLTCVTLPKVSIVLLYLRIFDSDRHVRIASWVVMAAVLIWMVAGYVICITSCQPFPFRWDKTIPGGQCDDLIPVYRYTCFPNILTDLAILILPIAPLYRLRMKPMRKVGLMIVILTGSLGIISAIIRSVEFFTIPADVDPIYYNVGKATFIALECISYFVCSCLPGIQPLLRISYKRLKDKGSTNPWGRGQQANNACGRAERGTSKNLGTIHSPLGETYSCHIASGSENALAGPIRDGSDGETSRSDQLIRLKETFTVDIESRCTSYSEADVRTDWEHILSSTR